MAVTQNQYTGNGSTVLFSFTFPYLASTDVKVKVDGTDTTAFTLANATTVQMNAAPANGAVVVVYRNTDNDNKKATFYPGSAIKAEDLNNDFDQILYVAQEVDNNALDALGTSPMQANLNIGGHKLTNVGTPTAGTDAANKTYVDNQTASGIDSALAAGTDLSKATSSGVTTFAHNVTGANQTVNNSNGTVLQDITITAQGHVTSAGSTDLDTRYYTKTTLDGGHFDGRYYTETELNAGQLNNQYYTETELDAGQLDNRYYTETELNAGQLDNRYYTEAELNAGQLDTRYFRQDSSETISQGDNWSGSDNYIATTAAIDARITDLVEEVGGFVPIANETSFPTSNPDINNAAGTLISIKAMSSSRTPSGGVVTIADGAGSGVTVTINGCGTTVLTAGYGVILETTSTTHTYNFHRLSPSTLSITTVSNNISNINAVANNETNINAVNNNSTNINAVANNNSNITAVAGNATNINAVAPNVSNISAVNSNATNINTVAGNNTNINTVATNAASVSTVATNISSVNNFADRYRVASSAPSSSLDVGDLYFDTTGNELKVYNGSAWQGGVTATGNLVSKSGDEFTGNITFSGSQTVDGRDLSVDGAKLDGIAISANNYAISSDLLDQDDMVANSATKVPSQQSVKAYVDNQTLSLIDEDDMSTDSATRPPSQQSVKAYADTKAPKASPAFTGTATGVNLTLSGDLTVNGTTTTLNSTTVSIDDKNLELGKVATPTDTTADGGGITLKGGTDKTFNWVNTTDAWTSSEHIHIGDSKKLLVGNGSDLYLQHNGQDSNIINSTGDLYIQNTGDDINIRAQDDINLQVQNGETAINCIGSGTVELFHANSKKLETTSSGAKLSGNLQLDLGSGNDAYIYNSNAGGLVFQADDNGHTFQTWSGSWQTRLTIADNGSVGIGTTSPNAALECLGESVRIRQSANSSDGILDFYGQNTSNGAIIRSYGSDGSAGHFYFRNANTTALTIDSSGKVGIGTTSPSRSLDINSGTVNVVARFKSTDATAVALFEDDSGSAEIGCTGTSVVFLPDGTEKMRLDSSGRVLIGTTTEGEGSADNLTIADSGACGITIRSGTSDNGQIFFSDGTSGDDEYRGQLKYKHNDNSFIISTNATTALTLDSSQNATFAGTVSDSKGNLRDIPVNAQSSSATYTATLADAGKAIHAHGTTQTVAIDGNLVWTAGMALTIINADSTELTITATNSMSLRNSATATAGNKKLAQYGMATILFTGTTTGYISGAGLTDA